MKLGLHFQIGMEKATNLIVDTEELWHNTYIKGRKYANTTKTSALGRAHRATATLWSAGENPNSLDSPSGRYFLSDDYGRFQGDEDHGRRFCRTYMPVFKKYFDNIKTNGYTTRISTMPIDIIDDEPYLLDGNRRIACIMAIGKQKKIDVKIGDHTPWLKAGLTLAHRLLLTSYLKSEGKKILYQPILASPFSRFSTLSSRRDYQFAASMLLGLCGNVEKKRVLDVGCCYGYYSFMFVKAGAHVTGVDLDPERVALCKTLPILYEYTDWSNPLFIYNDIRKYITKTTLTFDYTLMMNVFHHIYAKNEVLAWDTLNKIANKSTCVFLTMSSTSPKNIGKQEDIPILILENSVLTMYKDFGPIPPFGRNLFVFCK